MEKELKIKYFIYNKDKGYTDFNYYKISNVESKNIIPELLKLPKDVIEIYSSKERLIKNRFSGLFCGYDIDFINNFTDIINCKIETIFVIVFNQDNLDEIISNVKQRNLVFLSNTLDTVESINLYNIKDISISKIQKIYDSILDKYSKDQQTYISKIKEIIFQNNNHELINIQGTLINHIYTLSNLNILNSIRCTFNEEETPTVEELDIEKTTFYINEIRTKIDGSIKSEIDRKPLFDYIFSDFSYNFEFLLNQKKYTKHSLIKSGLENIDDFLDALKFIKRSHLLELKSDLLSNEYIKEYFNERIYLEQLISIKASSFVSPHIKIKLNPNDYKGLLKEVGDASRGSTEKLNKSFKKLENKLKDDFSDNLVYLNANSLKIKLISNLPMEWVDESSLPLMIKHEVSRIPITPSFLSERLILDNKQLRLTTESFKEILIISSFKDNDPIKNDLFFSVNEISKITNDTKKMTEMTNDLLSRNQKTRGMKLKEGIDVFENSIKWENVKNKDELIAVLNKNTCAVTIFDLHGSHDENGYGLIHLKDEDVLVESLIGMVSISPIVILSTCDTSPYDRNHNNTANGFLLLGAKTVLASAVPILSKESSIFISRFVLRLKHFLFAQIYSLKKSIRWSSLITGMLRMTYYTELIFSLRKKIYFTDQQLNNMLFNVNININPLMPNAFNLIKENIIQTTGISEEDFNTFIDKKFKFPEAIKYIQIGNPELILIVSEDEIPIKK